MRSATAFLQRVFCLPQPRPFDLTPHMDAEQILNILDSNQLPSAENRAIVPRIGILHQNLMDTPGGAAAVCVWTLQALRNDFNITLFTYGRRVDLSELNQFYGTELKAGDIDIMYLDASARLSRVPLLQRSRSLQLAFAIRAARRLTTAFDLMIATANECDLGRSCLQYVHFPLRNWRALDAEYGIDHPLMRKLVHAAFVAASGFNPTNASRQPFLTNSCWTKALIEKVYPGASVEVLYPPVRLLRMPIPWDARENGFVCSGRLVRSKRILEIIEILRRVRSRGYDVHLHIAGGGEGEYAERVRAIAAKSSWISCEGWITRDRLEDLLTSHRYGLHAMEVEHFGISVAEMVLSGAVPFVCGRGGQIEVVGGMHELVCSSVAEAVDKVIAVLQSACLSEKVRDSLASQSSLFSSDTFMRGMRERVLRFALEQTPC